MFFLRTLIFLCFRLQEFDHAALKAYFDQDALLYPIEEIIQKIETRDETPFLRKMQNVL